MRVGPIRFGMARGQQRLCGASPPSRRRQTFAAGRGARNARRSSAVLCRARSFQTRSSVPGLVRIDRQGEVGLVVRPPVGETEVEGDRARAARITRCMGNGF
eukprot:gene25682-biopygen15055